MSEGVIENIPVSSPPEVFKKFKTFGKTCVVLLPSESTKVILQYEPTLRVSAIMPAVTRKIKASNSPSSRTGWSEELEINVPTTIMSCSFVDDTGYTKVKDFPTMNSANWAIWAVDDSKIDGIYAAPYEVGNVHAGGNICFGSVQPITLRHAHNLFWSIPFTDHLWSGRNKTCKTCPKSNKLHKFGDTRHLKSHKYKSNHAPDHSKNGCSCPTNIFHQHSCLGTRSGLVREANQRTSLIKSFKKRYEAGELTETQFKEELTYESANCKCCESVFKGNNDCGCRTRHKLNCSCSNSCRCPCKCDCCNSKCKCKCSCYCCSGKCACPCSCYKDKFIKSLKDYDFTKNLKWSNMTFAICGDRYFAKPVRAGGLLLSSSPDILVEIPKKFWKEYPVSSRDAYNYNKIVKTGFPFVVGLGRPSGDGVNWDFEVGDVKFSLPESKLVFK